MDTQPEAASETSAPVIVEGPSGLRVEGARCSVHGVWYTRTYIALLNTWSGKCPECKRDEQFEAQARELLSRRAGEIRVKVESLLPDYEAQVQEQAEAEAQAYLKEVKPQLLADVRARLWEQLESQIESEMVGGIAAELKAKGA